MKTTKSKRTYRAWIPVSKRGLIAISLVTLCAYVFGESLDKEDWYKNMRFVDLSIPVPEDSTAKDTTRPELKFPIKDKNPNSNEEYKNNLDLKNPPNITTEYKYNTETGKYEKVRKIGNFVLDKTEISFTEYVNNRFKKEEKDYFKEKSKSTAFVGGNSKTPKLGVNPDIMGDLFDGGLVDIQPSGSAELMFGGNFNTIRNPQLNARQQKTGQFDFDQKLQLNVRGKIGNRIQMGIKYDTEATFDFENETNLDWVGKKDDIIKKIELGNVSLPLNGSLISGGQGLFGIKTELQFGRLTVTSILTQDKGESNSVEVKGGAQITEFNIQANEYDANRHYFLSQFFKDQYDEALSNLPAVLSSVSIEKIEVWVTNKNGSVNQPRDIVSLMDLGEFSPENGVIAPQNTDPVTDNNANDLLSKLTGPNGTRLSGEIVNSINTNFSGALKPGLDYDLVNYARLLGESEYEINRRLGYISLNTALNNDEVLAVAFEFYYNGKLYRVGEFTQDVALNRQEANVLFVKMLKPSLMRTNLPVWDLMMKNIYSLGTYNLNTNDLRFNVTYADDKSGARLNYLPVEGEAAFADKKPLLSVFNMDRVNRTLEAKPDGVLDVIAGVTVDTRRGRIIFPVREPFGEYLEARLSKQEDKDFYVYHALYDSTKFWAEQDVSHNKFFLNGSYKGNSSSRISLGAFNIPRGSVKVELNGSMLTENQDYIVDYNIGEVTIINESILASGGVVKASFENNALFNVQQKTLVGTRLDYVINEDFTFGGTFMHMYERPLTPKTNIGSEPIKNSIFGFDGSYTKKSRFLTKLVDKIPLIETKEESSITIEGEFAKIIPHAPKALGKAKGVSYIDDFEAAETPYDIKGVYNWYTASTPQGQSDLFPEANLNSPKVNWMDRRANFTWYTIDPLYNRGDRFTPEHIKKDIEQLSNHYVRRINVTEVFKNKSIPTGTGVPTVLPTLDLTFFPKTRGQYNFNKNPADWNANGESTKPEENWGGIMSKISVNDFEAANIDYLEIWIMDPFIYNQNNSGELYINLGNVSEDVLPDGRKSFENGVPENGDINTLAKTEFGRAPLLPSITNSFSADEGYRGRQDVGLDLMNDEEERAFWDSAYLKPLETAFGTGSLIYQNARLDPANDNFIYHRDPSYEASETGIIGRYSRYNHVQGNASTDQLDDGTPASASYLPDVEDINNDNTSNVTEDYYQYKIDLSPADLVVGRNYVTDKVLTNPVTLANGKKEQIHYYQIKIPIHEFQKRVGNIPDFKSIRFMRIFMRGFKDTVTLRIAQMQLVRADWRRYQLSLKEPGIIIPTDPGDDTKFSVSTVNIEENGNKQPVNYVVPPGIIREDDRTDPNAAAEQNEQSLSLEVCDLKPGDSKAVYKTSNIDARNYKNIKMFVHAEGEILQDNEMSAFIRIGTDLISNYYEYEVPLVLSTPGLKQPTDVWPEANNMDFLMSVLNEAKLGRDDLGGSILKPYTITSGGRTITVMGKPNLSNLKAMMLGVRNRTDKTLCGEVWFNELRLQGINNNGGWAANARVVTKLADFSTVNASGSIKKIGFGAVDQSLNERSLEDVKQFNVSTNTQLGKFFPKKSGVSIPMYVGYSETHILPKYYPLVPDVELQTKLDKAKSREERDSIREAAIDFTSRYSINFTNVKKNRTGGRKSPMPWAIENFNATYAYTRESRHNQEILENDALTYHGSLGYNYSPKFRGFYPFKKLIKSRKWAIIRDINFNPLPSSVNIRADVDRYYSELQYRSNDAFAFESPRLYDKLFTMTRVYNANFNLTKSLKMDYSANTNARIVEPFGELDSEQKRDSVKQSFYNFGTMSKFNQTTSLTYSLPFSKVKLLNWISASARYSANYAWDQAPPATDFLGNTIQNSRVQSINGQLNFVSFYNKFPALRKLTRRRPVRRNPADTTKKKSNPNSFGNTMIKGLLMIKNVSLAYTNNQGTVLPGFQPNIDHFGQNFKRDQPGWEFIFGSQNPEIRYTLANQEALSNDPRQSNYFTQTQTDNISGKITLQPLKDFRINLDLFKREGETYRSSFRYDTAIGAFNDIGFVNTRTYSISYIFWRTAFTKDDASNSSPVFTQFENNRYVIANRLQDQDPRVLSGSEDTVTNFPLGYSKSSQDVLLPAFLAAYTGKNSANQSLAFPRIPLPSWRINYNGLGKLDIFKNTFSNITLRHAYKGTYTVAGMQNNPLYDENAAPEEGESFESQERINSATIIEALTPLLGIDATFKNGWNIKLEMKQSRNVNFFISAFSVTETKSSEFVIGAGYRSDDVKLPIRIKGRRVYLNNDFNFHLDFSIRNDKTIIRKLDQPLEEPSSGNRIILINPTVDYMLNDKMNLNIFYMRSMSKPATTISFPTALTEFGIKLRYTIQ